MERIDRREALGKLGLVFGGVLLWGVPVPTVPTVPTVAEPSLPPASLPKPVTLPEESTLLKPEKKIRKILGFHDTPNTGGSIDIPLAISDVLRLGGRGLTVINPSEHLLVATQAVGLTIVDRIYHPDNFFDGQLIEAEVTKLFRYVKEPIFQLYNEVNLRRENNGAFVSPEEHIETRFVPAAKLVSKVAHLFGRRARLLTTPLAQKAPEVNGLNEEAYFKEMLDYLSLHARELDGDLLLGLHAYIFDPEDKDPLKHVRERYKEAKKRLGDIPIYVTEAGLHHNEDTDYSQDVIAAATVNILNTSIPDDLPIEGYDIWVLSNYHQRPPSHWERRNKMLDNFEKAAFRQLDGVTPAYKLLAALAAGKVPDFEKV